MKNNWIPMPRFLLRKNALIKILKGIKLNNMNCLEIGFGSGDILKLIASKGSFITGFDFSNKAVEIAQQRIHNFKWKKHIRITKNIKDIAHSSYDIVMAFEVLEHIKDDELEIDNWLSYIKPGGSLILSVPAHMSKWNASDIWAGHYKRYEKNELIKMFEKRNIEIIKLWNYGFPLSLVLDKLLGAAKKNEVKGYDENTNKAELSKNSGIDRKNKLIYRMLSNDIALSPFYLIQSMFFNSDKGSGYILHVKKNEKK